MRQVEWVRQVEGMRKVEQVRQVEWVRQVEGGGHEREQRERDSEGEMLRKQFNPCEVPTRG